MRWCLAFSIAFTTIGSTMSHAQVLPKSYGMSAAEVSNVMARLADAQRIAKEGRPLPFELICTDEQESGICDGGGRNALATLPLDRVFRIMPIYNTTCVRVVFEYPGDVCPQSTQYQPREIEAFELTLPVAAGGGYTWIVGMKSATKLDVLVLERGMVIYH